MRSAERTDTPEEHEPEPADGPGLAGQTAADRGDTAGRQALRLRALAIERFLGIEGSERAIHFDAGTLSPSLTIVAGPNASGKTTTARAIRRVIWPEAGGGPARLRAELTIGDTAWSLEIDGSSHRWRRDGNVLRAPVSCPVEERDRYTLSLHELLTADDRALAAHIRRELSGGYSLAEARDALGFSDRPSRPRGDFQTLRAVNERIREATREQSRLRERENTLAALRRDADQAAAAAREGDVVSALLAWREAGRKFVQARRRLARFDPRMGRLRGDELDNLRDWRGKIRKADVAIDQYEEALKECDTELRQINDGRDLPDETQLETCRTWVQDAKRTQSEALNARKAFEGARRKALEARKRIGEALTDEQLEELDRLQPSEALADAVRVADELAVAEGVSTRFQALAYTEEADHNAPSEDNLRRGIDALRAWLREPEPETPACTPLARWPALLAVAGVVAALVMAWGVHGSMLLPAAILAVLAWVLWPRQQPAAAPSRRPEWQDTFTGLGFDAPTSWTADAVRTRIDDLEVQWRQRRLAHTLLERDRLLLKELRQEAAKRRETYERLRNTIRGEVGVVLADVAEQPLAVFHLVGRIAAFQDARDAVEAARAEWETTEQHAAQCLEALQGALQPFAEQAIDEIVTAEHVIRSLSRQVQRRNQTREKLKELQHNLHVRRTERRNLRERCAELLAGIGLSGEAVERAETVLAEWLPMREVFTEAQAECRRCEAAVENQRKTAKSHGRDRLEPLQSMRTPLLRERLGELKQNAEKHSALLKEMTEIETLVRQAKQGHQLEKLLAERDRVLRTLTAKREQGRADIAGDALCSMVSARLETRASGVLRRAQALITEITHGRYRLVVRETNEGAELRARDNTTGTLHSLDTLSSGTRVQLLVAARLAFLEATEGQGPMLPLVLDEILGNSDDERAGAVIDAVLAAVRLGRQVITFTAQEDEVGKWRRHLERGAIPYSVLELPAGVAVSPPEVSGESVPPPAVPSPEQAESYVDYAKLLRVPAIVPGQTSIGGLHLWYVVENDGALFALVSAGYSRWGQLEQLMDQGGAEAVDALLPDDCRTSCSRLNARAELFDQLLSFLALGRGRPVDRMTLEQSGAVSDRFIDEVAALAESVDGRADAIIAALEEGDVKGFRTKNIESLHDWFLDNGYIDPRDPLDKDDLRIRLHAGVARHIACEALTLQDVESALRIADTII